VYIRIYIESVGGGERRELGNISTSRVFYYHNYRSSRSNGNSDNSGISWCRC
jgi:hypothetical protein